MLAAALALSAGCTITQTQHARAVRTKQTQSSITSERAVAMLMDGNRRFMAGHSIRRDWPAEVHATADGQYPHAAIVSCMDSRTPMEVVLDQGLGDIFSVRIAGNVVDEDVLASLEYAAKVAGVKVIAVIGHSHCGAIKGAIDDVRMGNLSTLLEKIKQAIPSGQGGQTSKDAKFVEEVAAANVRHSMKEIREKSPILKQLIDSHELWLVGGMYDIDSGRVEFYAP